MKNLSVFVLTHNRVDLLKETLESVFQQTCHDFRLILSDNSSNDETKIMLEESDWINSLEYRKRERVLSPFDHFNLCLSEVDTDYFIFFHDDDLMKPNFIERMYAEICGSDYVAVGCNAYNFSSDSGIDSSSLRKVHSDIEIQSTDFLIESYMKCSTVPYPSYIYSNKLRHGEIYKLQAGKYSDVTWLLRLLRHEKMKWLSEPLMLYRVHSGQDSSSFDARSHVKLCANYNKYCSKKKKITRKIKKYWVNAMYYIWSVGVTQGKGKYMKSLGRIFFRYSPFKYFPRFLIKSLFQF